MPIVDRDVIRIPAGTLDDDPGLRPQGHIFVDFKVAWFDITVSLRSTSSSSWVRWVLASDARASRVMPHSNWSHRPVVVVEWAADGLGHAPNPSPFYHLRDTLGVREQYAG